MWWVDHHLQGFSSHIVEMTSTKCSPTACFVLVVAAKTGMSGSLMEPICMNSEFMSSEPPILFTHRTHDSGYSLPFGLYHYPWEQAPLFLIPNRALSVIIDSRHVRDISLDVWGL